MTQADPNIPIVITKTINAPIERVWKAHVDPQDLKQWMHADEDWTTPFAEVDLRVGGKIRIGFGSPDGKNDFTMESTFKEIKEPEKLVYAFSEELGKDRVVTITLVDLGDGETKVTTSFTPETINSEEKQ